MKILYIIRTPFGAMGEPAIQMFATLSSAIHDVLVLEPNPEGISNTGSSALNGARRVNIYDQETKQQVANVLNQIQQFNPDIIHMTQSPHCFYYAYYLRHLTPRAKWVMDFRSPHVGDKDSPALKRYFYLQFFVDAVATHSLASLKTNIRYLFKRPTELPPGVDLNYFNTLPDRAGSIRKFVFVSSLSKTRKINFLVTAFSKFAKEMKLPVTLDIYGDGNATNEMLDLISKNKAAGQIFYKGKIPQSELLKKLPDYDAGIAYVPYEKFTCAPSLKSLEYAAAGLHILASDTQGHKEYKKKYGFKFSLFKNSLESFVDVLHQAVQNNIPWEHVERNRQTVKVFDWNSIANQKLFPLYERLAP